MENRPLNEHENYERVKRIHGRNHTPNHEEDPRASLAIVKAGLEKLRPLDLRAIMRTNK